MPDSKKHNFLKGAAILAATSVFVKIVGAIYRIPIMRLLGAEGSGYYQVTFNVFSVVLGLATAGITVTLSRLISSASANGDRLLVSRYHKVALPAFMIIGFLATAFMIVFADYLASTLGAPHAATGIRIIAPAVFFVCIISVYRGYTQGHEYMVPTAASQIIEVVSKALIGITAAVVLVGYSMPPYHVSWGVVSATTIGSALCIPVMIYFKRKTDAKVKNISAPLQTQCDDALKHDGSVFVKIMKVFLPITISASLLSIVNLVDTGIVMGRLQSVFDMTESESVLQFGLLAQVSSVYNLPPSLIFPLAISIVPAIAAALAGKRNSEAKAIAISSVKISNLLAMPAAAGIMVLAAPILNVLFNASGQAPEDYRTMIILMIILGAASFFVCFNHVSIAALQANGLERVALISFPVGAAIKLSLSYILVAQPGFGVIGSAIGTLACFVTVSIINFLVLIIKTKQPARFASVFLKPILCAFAMAVAVFFTYYYANILIGHVLSGIISLAIAVIVGVVIYSLLVIITKTISKSDLSHVPKGDKIAKILKVK